MFLPSLQPFGALALRDPRVGEPVSALQSQVASRHRLKQNAMRSSFYDQIIPTQAAKAVILLDDRSWIFSKHHHGLPRFGKGLWVIDRDRIDKFGAAAGEFHVLDRMELITMGQAAIVEPRGVIVGIGVHH